MNEIFSSLNAEMIVSTLMGPLGFSSLELRPSFLAILLNWGKNFLILLRDFFPSEGLTCGLIIVSNSLESKMLIIKVFFFVVLTCSLFCHPCPYQHTQTFHQYPLHWQEQEDSSSWTGNQPWWRTCPWFSISWLWSSGDKGQIRK